MITQIYSHSSAVELLVLSKVSFHRCAHLVPLLLPSLRASDQQFCLRLQTGGPPPEVQCLKAGRALAIGAELRYASQLDHLKRWRRDQVKDERAAFIWGLVNAYTVEHDNSAVNALAQPKLVALPPPSM